MHSINIALAVTVITAVTTSIFIPSGNSVPDGYWESSDSYVYYTHEKATCESVSDDSVYFWVEDVGPFDAYIFDSELTKGDEVELTFKNHETKEEYYQAQECGIESVTRVDNATIVAIDLI